LAGRPALTPGRALWPPPRVTCQHHNVMLKSLPMPYDMAILLPVFTPSSPNVLFRSSEVR
jgi:hypothetical protein